MGRGPLSLALCALAVSCFAGQQYKWVDLQLPRPPGATTGSSSSGVGKVLSDGSFVAGGNYGAPGGGTYVGTFLHSDSKGWSPFIQQSFLTTINSHGDYGYNGAYVYGAYTSQAGGTVHYAATGQDIPVPGPPGYSWAKIQDINDSGIRVGHYSAFFPDGTFGGSTAYYIRNGVIYYGSMLGANYGTFVGVDKNGYALSESSFWSPESGSINIPGLYIDYAVNQRPDFNDHFTVLQMAVPWHFAISYYSPSGHYDVAQPSFIPDDYINGIEVGGLNNSNVAVCSWRRKIVGNTYQSHWGLWDGSSWTDLYAAVKSQVPSGWLFNEVKDIDDYGRVYGTMKRQDGTYTIVRLDPVPEPTTLAALGLGALLLRRKKSATTRAA